MIRKLWADLGHSCHNRLWTCDQDFSPIRLCCCWWWWYDYTQSPHGPQSWSLISDWLVVSHISAQFHNKQKRDFHSVQAVTLNREHKTHNCTECTAPHSYLSSLSTFAEMFRKPPGSPGKPRPAPTFLLRTREKLRAWECLSPSCCLGFVDWWPARTLRETSTLRSHHHPGSLASLTSLRGSFGLKLENVQLWLSLAMITRSLSCRYDYVSYLTTLKIILCFAFWIHNETGMVHD